MYFPLYNGLIYNIISIMCSYLYLVHLFSFSFFLFFFFFWDKLHQLSLQFYKMTLTKTSYEITHPLKILWEGVWTQFIHSIILNNVKPFNIFYWKQILINPPFGLHCLHILSMIAKFSKRSRMNNHVINQMFKVQLFVI